MEDKMQHKCTIIKYTEIEGLKIPSPVHSES